MLDENQLREQVGFKEGLSTTDHLFIEKANEYQLEHCVGYIDYEKAFDTVEHSDFLAALRKKKGVSEGYRVGLQTTGQCTTGQCQLPDGSMFLAQ